ncbi:bifunctional purine biosynthesis protein PurH [Companilactobacillus sp. RD055328]|uniref:bifunctional phosphoribosylaminoimidazolecarboxamide formyltransferase/IMP cyclohydrolase n=1 Tax=Companilactobacillus sp. RD055328 TaxID=2916634 RepID=UPI001FC841EF|nr:bifunctional phosphoribosylaminoimidazolecarboxamide formyltransferase/IMP cyclohydrolase [Companilactobacillus sp. RD055328]GKQ42597.1 bifunctional purine biosynthesis protein PurH [Companilactobacillus sp. RD055328]
MKKKALLSVSDKTNLVDFAKQLLELDFEIISTGGTYKKLKDNNIDVTQVSEITNFPEMLDGRVKTLHPNIHGGILARLDLKNHLEDLEANDISPISLVCVNLYPFKETIQKENIKLEDAIEQIDIGGPSMLRSAAKNNKFVYSIVDYKDYDRVIEDIKNGEESNLKQELAAKVFRHTAQYDSLIAQYLTKEDFPDKLTQSFDFKEELRYGENSQQKAAFYQNALPTEFSISNANQLHGKELSYNNIKDINAAISIAKEFEEPCVVAMKHMNPCGVGIGKSIYEAWNKAYESDSISIFGGVIASNKEIDEKTAEKMHEIFLEIVIAPSFSKKAFEILSAKKNIRLITLDFEKANKSDRFEFTSVLGGMLVQEIDKSVDTANDIEVVTDTKPTDDEIKAMIFAQHVVKHVKSNAIVVATKDKTLGVGAGQMNRIGSAKIAIEQALQNGKEAPFVMASDAFFPMDDCVELAAKNGITAIIQPGGSIKDKDSIEMANKYGIAMVFTNKRHFKH